MISCNHMTTKLFGGCVCVCVWFIFNTHIFLYGYSYKFHSILLNKLKLIGDAGFGELMLKVLSIFQSDILILSENILKPLQLNF